MSRFASLPLQLRVPGGRLDAPAPGVLSRPTLGATGAVGGFARAGQIIGGAVQRLGERMLVAQRTSQLYRAETGLIAVEAQALQEIEKAEPGQGTGILAQRFDEFRDQLGEDITDNAVLGVMDQRIDRRLALTGAAIRRGERIRMNEQLIAESEVLVESDTERAANATTTSQRVDAIESIERTFANLRQAGAITRAAEITMFAKALENVGARVQELVQQRLITGQKQALEDYVNTSGDENRAAIAARVTGLIDAALAGKKAQQAKAIWQVQADALVRGRISSMARRGRAANRMGDTAAISDLLLETAGLPKKFNETGDLQVELESYLVVQARAEDGASRLLKMRSGATPFNAADVPKDPKSLGSYWNTLMSNGGDPAIEAGWLVERGVALPQPLIDALDRHGQAYDARELGLILQAIGRVDDSMARDLADRNTGDKVFAKTIYELTVRAEEGTPWFEDVVKLFTDDRTAARQAVAAAKVFLKGGEFGGEEIESFSIGEAFDDTLKLDDVHTTIDTIRQFDAFFVYSITSQAVRDRMDLRVAPKAMRKRAGEFAAASYGRSRTDLRVRGNDRRPMGRWLVPTFFNVGELREETPAKERLEEGLSQWQRDLGDSADVRPDLHVPFGGKVYIPAMSEGGAVDFYEWDFEPAVRGALERTADLPPTGRGRVLGAITNEDLELFSAIQRKLPQSHDAAARSRMAHLLFMPEYGVSSVEAFDTKFNPRGRGMMDSFLDWVEADIRAAGDIVDYDDPEQRESVELMLDARRRWAGWPRWDEGQ